MYLEWAPGNILNPDPSDGNQSNGPAVGEHDANRVLLEQHVGLSDVDVDPDRVEVWHLAFIDCDSLCLYTCCQWPDIFCFPDLGSCFVGKISTL